MLNILKYISEKVDGEARLSKFTNPIRQYSKEYPAVLFEVENAEDIDAIKTYYFNNYPNERIAGFVIPFYRLVSLANSLKDSVPTNVQLVCTVPNELFYFGRLKEDIASFYYKYDALPQEIRQRIQKIAITQSSHDKLRQHKEMWLQIISNRALLFKLVNAFVTPQVNFDMTVLENIGTFLFDIDDISTNTLCYEYGKKLYHTGNRDIENSGRMLCYPAHLHKKFLQRRSNIDELANSIHDADPKGVIFRLVDIGDIRENVELIDNYNHLIHRMKELSEALQIPSLFLSTRTEGLISLTRGIDGFSQSFNRSSNIPREIKGDKGMMQMRWRENPKLSSGSIYDYKTKEMLSREDFEKLLRQNSGVVNAPVGELGRTSLDEIINMTAPRFRRFSRMYLMATRNLEVQEIHDAIIQGTTRTMRSKFKPWIKDLTLFPE